MSGAPDRTSASGPLGSGQAFRVAAVAAMAIAAALAGPDAAHATTDTTFGSPLDTVAHGGVGEPVRAGRPGLALLGR